MLGLELVHDVLDGEAAGGGIGGHVLAEEDRHDLVADILVDVAAMRGDDIGEPLEIGVEHLDHRLRRARLGEGGVAADVGEEDRHLAPLAAEPDPAAVGLLDRGDGAAGDELGELEALVDLDDHGVDAARRGRRSRRGYGRR